MLTALAILQNVQLLGSAGNTTLKCKSPECEELANIYTKNMNANGNPCTDFYDYVCHGWGSSNPRRKYDLWDADTLLEVTAFENTRKILNDPKVSKVENFEEVKALYRACMNLPFMGEADANTIKSIIRTIGNWPMFPTNGSQSSRNLTWWEIENKYRNIAGDSSLFEYILRHTEEPDARIRLHLKAPTSPYGKITRFFSWYKPWEMDSYKAFLTKVIASVAPSSSNQFMNTINKDLDDVIKFREQVRNVIMNAGRLLTVQTKTIGQLQEWYNNMIPPNNREEIDWLAVIRSMYKNFTNAHSTVIQSSTKITIQSRYFEELIRVLGKTSKNVIENHIHIYFAEKHLILDEDMQAQLKKSVDSKKQRTGVITVEPDRWMFCIQNNMQEVLGEMYVSAYFRSEERQHVTSILNETRELLKTQILESTWLNSATKKDMTEKLNELTSQIGYPDWYMKECSTAKRTLCDINPMRADVYYSPKLNRIHISASYLQLPMYSLSLPYAIHYGSLMSTMAHEMYHVFDYYGFKIKLRAMNKTLAERKQYDDFEKHAQCFKERYNAYRAKLIANKKLISMHDLPETINEDIPDVMGLKLAYKKYREELSRRNGTCPILAGLEQFDCEKLFFIAHGNLYCADSDPTIESRLLLLDTHSHPKIRVNGAVENMKEFHQAFGCKPNPLALKEPCDIWK